MATTSIEWTDATWNPVTGCDRVSAGCDHCYALTLAKRLKAMGNPRYQRDGKPTTSGPGFGVTLHPDKLADPINWAKPRRVFVNSMSDLFHADVPSDFIARVFAVMAIAGVHTFQVLTKRPQRMKRLLNDPSWAVLVNTLRREIAHEQIIDVYDEMPWPLPNVWLGTSVENQEAAYRIDWLVKTPAAVRFLSCEPLIGPLDLSKWLWEEAGPAWAGSNPSPALDWVIAGGESGPKARPVDPDWIRSLRDQTTANGAAFFFKQWGGIRPKAGGRLLDGHEWSEFPLASEPAVGAGRGR